MGRGAGCIEGAAENAQFSHFAHPSAREGRPANLLYTANTSTNIQNALVTTCE